jgi:hypothetical protein
MANEGQDEEVGAERGNGGEGREREAKVKSSSRKRSPPTVALGNRDGHSVPAQFNIWCISSLAQLHAAHLALRWHLVCYLKSTGNRR